MQKMKLSEPEFKSLRGDFKVIFRKQYYEEEVIKTTPIITPITTPITKLNNTQEKILELIKINSQITQTSLAKKINITIDGIKYNITILKEKNILKREGSSRKGYWKILK